MRLITFFSVLFLSTPNGFAAEAGACGCTPGSLAVEYYEGCYISLVCMQNSISNCPVKIGEDIPADPSAFGHPKTSRGGVWVSVGPAQCD